jgi:hypothetical protein
MFDHICGPWKLEESRSFEEPELSTMFAGSFSYYNDESFEWKLDDAIQIRITRIDATIARLYFVSRIGTKNPENGNNETLAQIPVPTGLSLYESVSKNRVPIYHDEFLIAWTGNYELKRNGCTVLNLHVQRQQAIRVPPG